MVTALSDTSRQVLRDADLLRAAWQRRNERIRSWYNFRRLVDRWKESGKTSYVSNFPKVYFNLARHMLSANPLRPRVLMGSGETLTDRQNDSFTERAVSSIFRQFDDNQWQQGRLPWRVELADQICMGWVNLFYGVFRDEENPGKPVFRGDIWDNLTVYPEWDDEGLVTVVHEYTVSEAAAQAKAARFGVILPVAERATVGAKKPTGRLVTDWYRRDGKRVFHALLVDGHQVLPFEEMDGLERIPVLVAPVNGEAKRSSEDAMDDPTKWMGISILDPIERTVGDFNDWMTMVKQVTRDKVQPNYVDYTEDGQGFINIDDIRRGGGVHHGMITDKADVLPVPDLPTAVMDFIRLMDMERQMGSVPNTVFASVAADTSGYLYAQLQAAALTNVGPYREAQDFVLRMLGQAYVDGFRDGGFKTIRIQGRSRREGREGGYFFSDWNPSKIAKDIWVDVTTDLALLRNRAAEIATMRQANSQDILVDHTTLLDEIGGFDDPLEIQLRIEEDMVRKSPENIAAIKIGHFRKLAMFYREKGDMVQANAYNAVASRIEESLVPEQGPPEAPSPGLNPETFGVMGRNGQSEDAIRALLQRPAPQSSRNEEEPQLYAT